MLNEKLRINTEIVSFVEIILPHLHTLFTDKTKYEAH